MKSSEHFSFFHYCIAMALKCFSVYNAIHKWCMFEFKALIPHNKTCLSVVQTCMVIIVWWRVKTLCQICNRCRWFPLLEICSESRTSRVLFPSADYTFKFEALFTRIVRNFFCIKILVHIITSWVWAMRRVLKTNYLLKSPVLATRL